MFALRRTLFSVVLSSNRPIFRFSSAIHDIQSEAAFDKKAKEVKNPILVAFHSIDCELCKTVVPRLTKKAVESQTEWTLFKVDVDKNVPIQVRYNIKVIPSTLLMNKGKVITVKPGAITEQEIDQLLSMKEDEPKVYPQGTPQKAQWVKRPTETGDEARMPTEQQHIRRGIPDPDKGIVHPDARTEEKAAKFRDFSVEGGVDNDPNRTTLQDSRAKTDNWRKPVAGLDENVKDPEPGRDLKDNKLKENKSEREQPKEGHRPDEWVKKQERLSEQKDKKIQSQN